MPRKSRLVDLDDVVGYAVSRRAVDEIKVDVGFDDADRPRFGLDRHQVGDLEVHLKLAEFDHVACRNASGRTVEQVLIDDGAKLRSRKGVVPPHQIPDLEIAVFTDGLQRRNDVSNIAAIGKRQQQALICDDSAVDVIDIGDGVDGKRALDARVVDRHHDGRESGPEIFVEIPALAGVAIGAGHPRAVAFDRQTWWLSRCVHGQVDQIREFIGKPRGLVLFHARHALIAGI